MRSISQDSQQTGQRLRVGLTGLIVVLLLIGLASAVFRSASKEAPVDAVGAPKPEVVANLAVTNDSAAAAAQSTTEPLAELGVTPSLANQTDGAAATPPAK